MNKPNSPVPPLPPVASIAVSTSGKPMFFGPEAETWKELKPDVQVGTDSSTGDEVGTPLEGVFHIYKLHGSVNWSRKAENEIEVEPTPTPDSACLIYPAKGKYQ